MATQKERIDKAVKSAVKLRDKLVQERIDELTGHLRQASDDMLAELAKLDAADALQPYQVRRQEALKSMLDQVDAMQRNLASNMSLRASESSQEAVKLGIEDGIGQLKAFYVPEFRDLDDAAMKALVNRTFATIDVTAVEFLANYQIQLLGSVSETLASGIKGAIQRGVLEGLSIPDIRKLIGKTVTDPEAFRRAGKSVFKSAQQRATLIARTETLRAHNMGRLAFYAEAGVDEVKWITAEDERTCPICRPLDGKVFKIEDLDGPPIHPSCRCSVVAVLPEDEDEDE